MLAQKLTEGIHLQSSPLPFDLKERSSLPVKAISAGGREQPEGWSFVSCQSKGFRPHGDRWWRNRRGVGGYSTKGCQHMGSLLHELRDNWDGKEQRSGRDKTAKMGVILTAFKGQLHVWKCQDVSGHLLLCLSTQLPPDHTAFFCSDKACRFKRRGSHCICIQMEVNWSSEKKSWAVVGGQPSGKPDCPYERKMFGAFFVKVAESLNVINRYSSPPCYWVASTKLFKSENIFNSRC